MKVIRRSVTILALLAFAAACGDDVSGTYADEGSVTAYQFHGDGRVTISVLGTTVPAEYSQQGDRVLVTSAQGTVVLREQDDRLYGPMGLELVKRQE